MIQIRIPRRAATLAMVLLSPAFAVADELDDIGYRALVERLGAAAPSGAGVGLGQVEVPNPGYGPSQSNSEFAGVSFI